MKKVIHAVMNVVKDDPVEFPRADHGFIRFEFC